MAALARWTFAFLLLPAMAAAALAIPAAEAKDPPVEVRLQHFGFGGQAAAYTPDGRFLLWGAGYGGSVTLWDIRSRQLVRTFIGNSGSEIDAIAVSPDGQYFVAGADRGPASIFRIATGERVATIPGTDGAVNTVAYSHDGRFVAAGDDHAHLIVLDTATGKTASHEEDLLGFVALGFDPDGGDLVAVTTAGDVKRFKPKDLSLTKTSEATGGTISAAAFIPGTSRIVIGVYDGPITIWDYAGQKQVASFAGPSMSNLWFALSPDGSQLLTPADTADEERDGVILWDVAKGTEIRRLDISAFQPTISFDGAGLLEAGLNGIVVTSLTDGTLITSYGVPQTASVRDISPDGSIAYVAANDSHAVLATATGEKVDPDSVAEAGHMKVVEFKDGTVNVTDAVTGKAVGTVKMKWVPDYPTTGLSTDGKTKVVTEGEHTAVIPLDALDDAYDVPGLEDVDFIAVARNARVLATSTIGTDTHVELRSLPNGRLMRRLAMTGAAQVAFSPDDRILLAADLDGNVALYQVTSGAKVMAFTQACLPEAVGFSEDGRYFYDSCSNGATTVYDRKTGKDVLTFHADSAAEFVRFLADGKTILLGYSDGVKFVDIGSGALTAQRIFYSDGTSRMVTAEGFYDGSPNPREIRLVRGTDVYAATVADAVLNRPDLVAAKLAGDTDGAVAKAAAALDLASLVANAQPIGPAAGPAKAVPDKPTHVVIAATTVRDEPDDGAASQGDLTPGTQVAVMQSGGGWSLIARGGKRLGYVPGSSLAPLQ